MGDHADKSVEVVRAAEARRLLLAGHAMLEEPSRGDRCTPTRALALIRRLGFVQVDSINIVERAHHHILWTRDHAYRPPVLDGLQRRGQVFEHWTHDASIIPAEWFPHWRHRFERVASSKWFAGKLAAEKDQLLAMVRERVEREGPLLARDFEHAHGRKNGPWWDWKPAKTALEYLWRRGELAIVRREGFEKVYDLTHRALRVEEHTPSREEHIDWSCAGAMERLGVATATEVARFWNAATIGEARAWCEKAAAEGRVVPVRVRGVDGSERPAFARADWKRALGRAEAAPARARVLSPFDPIVRDRARALRLFGFDYRFEAFVPAAKRRHGYYVMPILAGERLVGRVDAALDRRARVLRVLGAWWEGKPAARERRRVLGEAMQGYAEFLGAQEWSDEKRK